MSIFTVVCQHFDDRFLLTMVKWPAKRKQIKIARSREYNFLAHPQDSVDSNPPEARFFISGVHYEVSCG
jgi:hypothetical protein